jgi:uncharacterized membrane protein YgcG
MTGRIWSALIGVFLLLTLSLMACETTISTGASQDPPIPHITRQDRGWVDPTGRVNASTLETLRQQSDVFESESFQLAGVFFSDVVSDPSKIAADFGNENGIGSANKDNGLVILVLLDRQGTDGTRPYIFVATGKGLEGLLNDAKVTRFREAYFNPLRAQGQWEQGLSKLCSKFAEYLKNPEAQAFSDASLDRTAQPPSQQQAPLWQFIVFVVALVIFFGVGLLVIRRGRRFGGPGGGAGSPVPWSSGSSGGGSYGGGGSFGGGGSGG